MSMTTLTVLQTAGVAAAYLCVTLLLPWLLLRGKFAELKAPARFMAYFLAGNFYIINLVFLLQLLHISFRLTLAAGTLAPFIAAALRKDRIFALSALERWTERFRRVFEGELGVKTVMLRIWRRIRRLSFVSLGKWLRPRWADLILMAGSIALVLYMYGTNTVRVYGYCASDMVLHNYWINGMDGNRIFVDGVYPFGFHCMMYYLHTLFGIPTYVLLRVFAIVQTTMIHLMLFAFLRCCCKSKYAPYMGVFSFAAWDIYYPYVYYRYYAALPQEYGMLFILPAAWFAFDFLQEKSFPAAAGKDGEGKRKARLCLILFAVSISLTFAVHFYDTVIAGIFCVGIAVGYCFRCLRWRYLWRIAAAGIAGLLVALLPMAAAYAMGTPLQGSLYWGMNFVSESVGEEAETDTEKGAEEAEKETLEEAEKEMSEETGSGQMPFWKRLESIGRNTLLHVLKEAEYYLTQRSMTVAEFMFGSVGGLFALGCLCFVFRRADYGAVLLSLCVYTAILFILQASEKLGLPQLMDISRFSIYIAYALPAVWALSMDAVLFLLLRERHSMHTGSLALLASGCVAVVLTGFRTPDRMSAYESNGAIICLTNIIRENRGGAAWTICSANDEQQMLQGYGYHYELIDFLRDMETLEDASTTIPTDTVYFFIEKVPLLYPDVMNKIKPDREVSTEGAEMPLSKEKGILPYIEDERWVTMSHMYYWAQAFRELYPNEMEVYYETDDFVCYRIRQNGYELYDFAIDYGYN